MMDKILDLQAIKEATASLERIAAEHPHLLGKSTPDEWEEVLSEAIGSGPKSGAERQRAMRQKRLGRGLTRPEVWASPEDLDALRKAYPGPRQGIDWQAIIATALAFPNTPESGGISADPDLLPLVQELRADLNELDVAHCAALRENAELRADLEASRQEAERLRHDLEYERNERNRKPARK